MKITSYCIFKSILNLTYSLINNSNGFFISYKRTLIFHFHLYTMEHPFELLIYEWAARKVLDDVTSMTSL